MRHYKKGRKLGTDSSHTKAIKKNLAVALFTNDRIKTTLTRAKEVRGTIDHIITWAKKGDLHSRRLAIAALGDKELVREVFEKAEQGMWADRNGGYTRILKLGPRKGDNAPMAILELVEEAVVPKAKKDDKPAKGKKPATKAKKAETLEEKADSNKLDQTPDENIEETGEEAAESLADGGIQHENGAEGIDDVEEFAGGEEALTEEVATDHEREADLEAEKAKEEEAVEDAGLEREKAKIEKAEAENIEKIKEETAKEEAELLEAVDPVMKDEGDFAEAVEKTAEEEA